MPFAKLNLNPSILKAIAQCGYTEPTPIQAQAIPLALAGHDIIGSAQTGTGKTAAFVLPALQRLITPAASHVRGPRVLVLTPTRELASQVTDAVQSYGKFMRVRHGVILGGMPYREQLRLLSQPVDIIVATPGRLIDHLDRGSITLARLELLVLDEADRMLDMGFIEDVEKIAAKAPATRQTFLFSATIDARIKKLAGGMLKDPEMIQVAAKQITHENIEQRLIVADDLAHKSRLLQHFATDVNLHQAIIFSATKRDADFLARELYQLGHAAAALHGDMTQGARNKTITNMRRGRIRLLVATDVAARGLDVSGISHVINFDLPKCAEDYVHRIGRTGRAGASGIAVSFVSHNDINYLSRIERLTGTELPVHVIPGLEPKRPLRRLPSGRNGGPAGQGRGKGPGAGAKRAGGPGASRWGQKPGENRGAGGRPSGPTVIYKNKTSRPV
jgi:superfamily II DNA/RNA helicase